MLEQIRQFANFSDRTNSEAFRYDCSSTEIEVALGIMSSFENGSIGPSFRRGDVVQILYCLSQDVSLHSPFIVQAKMF